MEEIALSFPLPTLRSPAGASHWPNLRGSQPTIKGNWMMVAVEDRLSERNRGEKGK